MNLLDLLKQQEGKTLEFKRQLPSGDGFLRSVVSFGNTAGGAILIGVEDGTREVCGVPDPLRLEERIANLVSDGIRPLLLPEVEILPWRQTHVVAVIVHLSPNRPHYVKRMGSTAGVFVRIGSTNRRADAALLAELERSKRLGSFDEEPMPDLNSEAIDFRVASECFEQTRKLRRSDLRSLKLTTLHQGREVPTVGGVLLFGRDRLQHFPDARIQFARFAGIDRAEIRDRAEFKEPPTEAVALAIERVRRLASAGVTIGAVKNEERWVLPPEAIREAIINAVVHADYSQTGAPIRVAVFDDRLEVESPGLLPIGVTVPEIRRGLSKLRNRVLGRVFHELGLIEQWGSGIQRMSKACRAAGLDDPDLEEVGTHFRVTIRMAQTGTRVVDEVDQQILDVLASDEAGKTTKELAAAISRSPRATRTRVAALVIRGLVVEVGSSLRDPRRRYYLSDEQYVVPGSAIGNTET